MSGDVTVRISSSSPRVRRYFPLRDGDIRTWRLFSARAEVFPRLPRHYSTRSPLLRACGGISVEGPRAPGHEASSPRVRRYFPVSVKRQTTAPLFSARAEVFPLAPDSGGDLCPLLRACGGISKTREKSAHPVCSSPRVRRYFRQRRGGRVARRLFSARAEVFPPEEARCLIKAALLRACGGISA